MSSLNILEFTVGSVMLMQDNMKKVLEQRSLIILISLRHNITILIRNKLMHL